MKKARKRNYRLEYAERKARAEMCRRIAEVVKQALPESMIKVVWIPARKAGWGIARAKRRS